MKILLYGEGHRPGTGAWCYAETLRDMGCEVVVFADHERLEVYGRSIGFRAWLRMARKPWEFHRKQHVAQLIAVVKRERPEIVIILKGLYIGPDDIRELQAQSCWVVNINHDDFFSQNRNNWSHLQRKALHNYDYILTTRECNVAEVRRFNENVEFFPFAYYPRIHRPLKIPDTERAVWGVDVVFVGNYEQERSQLLEELVTRIRANYAIWGVQWHKVGRHSPLAPHIKGRSVVVDDMAKAIGGAKVALAFLRKENRDDYTQRTFEIPACSGVLLGERTRRHQEIYREGEEAEFFDHRSPDELASKVRMLLNDDVHRERVRAAGRAALLRQAYTYQDRMQRVLELFNKHHRAIRCSDENDRERKSISNGCL